MDFESFNRRELQALCKLNKIPANLTNVAMVDALKSLETVEGIEEFLNPSRSESPERIEVTSTRVPRTSCRTSTRQRVKKTEAEPLPATASRATSRGPRRQLAGDDNEFLKTPMVSSTRNKALASQLKECEDVSKRTAVKQETTVQRAYSTRRSTRLTAKKSDVPGVKEMERSEPVKIESFLDEVSIKSEEDLGNPIQEKDVSKPKVEDICNEFEKLDVVVGDESDQNSRIEKDLNVDATLEITEKVKSDEVSEQPENVHSEDKFVMNEVDNTEEKSGQLDNLKQDSEASEDEDLEEKQMVIDEKIDLNEEALDANASENTSDPSVLKNEVLECNDNLNVAESIEETVITAEVVVAELEEAQESLMEEVAVDVNPEQTTGDADEVTHDESAADASLIKEENQISDDDMEQPTLSKVSDNKENNSDMELEVVAVIEENEENINENDKAGPKSLNDTISLRQLKKQLKALTIKQNLDDKVGEERPALQEMDN